MIVFRRPLFVLLACAAIHPALAQNGSNSSYSRFGLGTLSDQSQGFNKGMGGVAQGLRDGAQINVQNPASYSALNEQNFVFDVGMSFQNGNYDFGSTRMNIRNTSFDYATIGFRARKNLGMSVGVIPFTQIGYSFNQSRNIGNDAFTGNALSVNEAYSGDGGTRQLYYGVGWMPVKNLSIGMNVSYIWGEYYHYISQTYYENGSASSNIAGLNRQYSADIKTYRFDFAAQYAVKTSSKSNLTLGGTVALGHNTKDDATVTNFLAGSDSVAHTVKDAFELPFSISAGAAWNYANRLTLAADYSLQKWGDCVSPALDPNSGEYIKSTSFYKDRHKFALGAEYVNNPNSRSYIDRVRFRLGGNYATPYQIINGVDGPSELSLGVGAALPITNKWNNRSVANISLQWVKTNASSSTLPTENYLRINVGVTFNERWFMKWKIE